MPRRVQASFDRNDIYRALLTDTAPNDVPLVYSNDGFRENIRSENIPADVEAVINCIVKDNDAPYLAPFRYKISHKEGRLRQLSLAHPAAQMRVAEFYQKYEHLITYYATRGRFSIRNPTKVASSFFYRSSLADMKKYRDSSVLEEELDALVRHPSSYFAYGGHVRFHTFFNSVDFHALEKRFSHMALLDITRCFNSIYTHTITWAVKDLAHGKDNAFAVSFGNDFDRLMQRMNYNETNGLAVGSEVSRICAEIVLQSVDERLRHRLSELHMTQGEQYDIRRYVDDYVVFANSEQTAKSVELLLADELGKINLHLNDDKAERLTRPFQTKMSAISDAVSNALEVFWSGNTERRGENGGYSVAVVESSRGKLARSFIREVKTLCHDSGANYGNVSPLLISAFDTRIQRIINSVDVLVLSSEEKVAQYHFLKTLIEVQYFFFSVHPSVASSYKVAKSTILSLRFVKQNFRDYEPDFSEFLTRMALEFLEKPFGELGMDGKFVPIEQLNILLSLTELSSRYVGELLPTVNKMLDARSIDYFSVVSIIFAFCRFPTFNLIRNRVESVLRDRFLPVMRLRMNSEDAHLMFDILSCPFLSDAFRNETLSAVFDKLGRGQIGRARRTAVLAYCREHPWFVQWEKIDLLRALEKRELNAVY